MKRKQFVIKEVYGKCSTTYVALPKVPMAMIHANPESVVLINVVPHESLINRSIHN